MASEALGSQDGTWTCCCERLPVHRDLQGGNVIFAFSLW